MPPARNAAMAPRPRAAVVSAMLRNSAPGRPRCLPGDRISSASSAFTHLNTWRTGASYHRVLGTPAGRRVVIFMSVCWCVLAVAASAHASSLPAGARIRVARVFDAPAFERAITHSYHITVNEIVVADVDCDGDADVASRQDDPPSIRLKGVDAQTPPLSARHCLAIDRALRVLETVDDLSTSRTTRQPRNRIFLFVTKTGLACFGTRGSSECNGDHGDPSIGFVLPECRSFSLFS